MRIRIKMTLNWLYKNKIIILKIQNDTLAYGMLKLNYYNLIYLYFNLLRIYYILNIVKKENYF